MMMMMVTTTTTMMITTIMTMMMMIIRLSHSVHLLNFYLQIRLSPFPVSVRTVQSPIYTSSSPLIFLPLRGQLRAIPLM